jgi:hypothetical protein
MELAQTLEIAVAPAPTGVTGAGGLLVPPPKKEVMAGPVNT